jgi:hypothetical protein
MKVVGQHAVAAGFIHEPTDVERELQSMRDRISLLELAVKSPLHGLHNQQTYDEQKALFDQVEEGDSYRDLSLIEVMPGYKPWPTAVGASYLNLSTSANQNLHRMYLNNYEVGHAYQHAIEAIMRDERQKPPLRDYHYVLTLEVDNIIPPMAVLQLLKDIHEADVDVLGAMYWGKGWGGVPMAFGKFGEVPHSFRPFVPPPNAVTRVNGCGMGCTLFDMKVFREVSSPWFETIQQWTPNVGMETMSTQDLFFARKAAQEAGIRFAVDTNVLVGHLEESTGIIW